MMKLEEFDVGDNPVQCSCCDYFSIARHGYCIICPVCFWEDEFYEDGKLMLDEPSDLNDDLTLRVARENFKKFGAHLPAFTNIVIDEEERLTLRFEARDI